MSSLEPLNKIPPEEVRAAAARIRKLAIRTPLVRLNHDGDHPIYLKLENLQPVGSFKIRCAANALLKRIEAGEGPAFATASAGNFAQGLAFAAKAAGASVTSVVPEAAAQSKLDGLRALGAQIRRVPYDEWWDLLESPPEQIEGAAFIHPVCDPDVVAGNGTIGLEILEDLPDVAAVIAPYGGGGLSTGIASYLKSERPDIKIFAGETEAGTPVAAAFKAGEPVEVDFNADTFVTGMGARRVLDAMWPLVRAVLDGAVEASLAETARAVRLLIERHHIIAEGAGAAPVAAATKAPPGTGPTVCIVSGGHLDARHITEILAGAEPPAP